MIRISANRFKNKYLKYTGVPIPLISFSFILQYEYVTLKLIGGDILITYLLFLMYVQLFEKTG